MNKKDLKKLVILFLISRLILVIFLIIKKDLSILNLYDAEHYINIAINGYNKPMLYAFFPLFPLLIKLFSFIIPNANIVGSLISNISTFISLIILNKITNNKKDNTLNIALLLFSPILAYNQIPYTESLFMMLTILGYYLYKKDKYFLSGLVVGLSSLSRNSGIILWGAIGLDMLYRLIKKKNIKFYNILIFGFTTLIISLIYPTYLYFKEGNFMYFATVQNTYWYREKGTIINGIIKDITVISNNFNFLNIYVALLNWLSLLFVFILGIKTFKKDKVSSIYIIVSCLAFTTMYRNIIIYPKTLGSVSLFRYVFNLFPIYIYALDNKNELINYIIFYLFFIISIFNTIIFYSGYFLA